MMRDWPEIWRKREEWYVLLRGCSLAKRRDRGRREGGGGYRAVARFTRGEEVGCV